MNVVPSFDFTTIVQTSQYCARWASSPTYSELISLLTGTLKNISGVWGHCCAQARQSSCRQGLKRGWTNSASPPQTGTVESALMTPRLVECVPAAVQRSPRVRGSFLIVVILWPPLLSSQLSGLHHYWAQLSLRHENCQHTADYYIFV